MLFSGRAYPELADEIGKELGVEPTPTEIYEFASGEMFVRYKESVRGCDAFVIQSMTTPINTWVMETLIMVDALKRGSAKRITVVLPFYPYARQDKKHRGREPISARLMADLFKTAGAEPDPHRRPAHRPDPGLLRRPGGPPVRDGHPGRVHREPVRRPVDGRGRARLGPGAGGRAVDRPARRLPAGLHPQDPRPVQAQRGRGQPGRR